MGLFLSLTGVIGKAEEEVANSMAKYARTAGGGFEKEDLPVDNDNCFVIEQANGNTTISNSNAYPDWDSSSAFISRDLNAPVFSFHIHDGDLWMYILFVNGEPVDQFNPIPDYWAEDMSEEDIQSWKGDASVVAKYAGNIQPSTIANYLTRWDLDAEEIGKAYPDDEYGNEDWQLLDFMKKLGLPYPLYDDGMPSGQTYKFWTKELPIKQSNIPSAGTSAPGKNEKPWWKFW